MARRWFVSMAGACAVAGLAVGAAAQEPQVSSASEAPVVARASLLPPTERLQLSWPIAPLSFSFVAAEEGNYAHGPLRTFHADATWLRLGRLSLLTTSAAGRGFELDCRSTCQPSLERSMAVEGRVHLFSTRAVPDAYLFTRWETRWSEAGTPRPVFAATRGLLRMGFGGLLDL